MTCTEHIGDYCSLNLKQLEFPPQGCMPLPSIQVAV